MLLHCPLCYHHHGNTGDLLHGRQNEIKKIIHVFICLLIETIQSHMEYLLLTFLTETYNLNPNSLKHIHFKNIN